MVQRCHLGIVFLCPQPKSIDASISMVIMLRTSPRSLDDSRSKRILMWKRWVPEESLWNGIDGLPDDWANSSSGGFELILYGWISRWISSMDSMDFTFGWGLDEFSSMSQSLSGTRWGAPHLQKANNLTKFHFPHRQLLQYLSFILK